MLHCPLLKLEQLERYIVTQREQVCLICEPVTLGVFIYPYMHDYVLDYFYVHYHYGLHCTGLVQLQLCSWFNAEDMWFIP